MKIAIIGFGVEGRAAYDYWRGQGGITICDQKIDLELPTDVAPQLGPDYLNGLDSFDVIVRSPFVRPDAIVAANSPAILDKITSCTNEFLRVCPTRNVIGITGTKGKGTTSTLTARMLEAAGKRVHLGGNIGLAALDLLKNNIQPNDWVVLELSSFQLIDLQRSPHIAACLMVVPEHQDWHTDIDEYYMAKQQLFVYQNADDISIYYPENENSVFIAGASDGRKIPYYQSPGAVANDGAIQIGDQVICNVSELKLLGEHNWQNVCAAVTIARQFTDDIAAIRSVATTFTGLEHRLEFVREISGVSYYDDSFGTTPETAQVAVQAFDQPKVLILGGSDKGANYDELARTVAGSQVHKVLLIGEQAARIHAALEQAGVTDIVAGGDTMTQIIDTARHVAEAGDVVLLSTGCASFGMFKDYKDRGNQFKQAVQALV